MFFPADSLRKGGRFYLLWLADSYPKRFAAIGNRPLWTQDIRKLCEDFRAVMVSESGHPSNRYSLRLSSQLIRGLVRLYEKKVNGLLNELCMIHANVSKLLHKKYMLEVESQQVRQRPRSRPPQRKSTAPRQTRPAEEPRVEEILQNSNNVVANIHDITLREAVIPEILLPPNDGFGEENPEHALQLLGDRTVEMMLVQPDTTAHRSAIELPAGEEISHDKTRLGAGVEMEMISGLDITVRPSVGGHSLVDFDKEIPEIPDVPLLPIPVPDPQEKQQQPNVPDAPVDNPPEERSRLTEIVQEPTQIELEELEEQEPRPKRPRRLIVDKKIEITSDVLRARTQNAYIELRCEKFSEAIIDIQVPMEVYMHRPSHAGYKERTHLAPAITRLFMRNLGYIRRETSSEREMEEGVMQRQRTLQASHLERIEEVAEPVVPQVSIPEQVERPQEIPAEENLPPLEVEIAKDLPNAPEQQDISEMLTQTLAALQEQREGAKRASDGATPAAKKPRYSELSIKGTQRKQRESRSVRQSAATGIENQPIIDTEVDKENVPLNQQTPRRISARDPNERRLTTILLEAGLGDVPAEAPQETDVVGNVPPPNRTKRSPDSESSETPLGSLDRTRVSLGDSDKTTDSVRFIRDQWGTLATMIIIFRCIRKRKDQEEINIKTLISEGPILPQYRNIIIAKCFSSILKLKQAEFIKVIKCPDSLEIKDIIPGPKLENYTF